MLGSGTASPQSVLSFPVTHFCISQKTCLELGHAVLQGKLPYKGSVLLLAVSSEPMRANQICWIKSNSQHFWSPQRHDCFVEPLRRASLCASSLAPGPRMSLWRNLNIQPYWCQWGLSDSFMRDTYLCFFPGAGGAVVAAAWCSLSFNMIAKKCCLRQWSGLCKTGCK